eukprot:Partr_v1_DN28297_c0_g1_i1_m76345 putative kiaa0528
MPCILKIRVSSARDLPVMDKASDLTDAYVEIKFADYDVQRTSVVRKTLNPVWNADFRIEVSDDADLQNEPVELRVLDYDTISANDVVGCVFIDMNPLLAWEASSTFDDSILVLGNASPVAVSPQLLPSNAPSNALPTGVAAPTGVTGGGERQISGWFPLYDTLLGLRGELHVQIKLQFFGDVNPFKDSSAGVCVFSSATAIPAGYRVRRLLGMVEVLLNENDPEFSWADTFRAPRTSNESRQRLFYRLSGQLRRLACKDVLEMGGNAIVAFQQSFDCESQGGLITARAIGTCVRLQAAPVAVLSTAGFADSVAGGAVSNSVVDAGGDANFVSSYASSDRSSSSSHNSDDASVDAVDEGKFSVSDGPAVLSRQNSTKPPSSPLRALYETPLEPVLLTLNSLPTGAVVEIGGVVSAKSVKLYRNNDIEVRKNWWWELREEVIAHAKQLSCQYVLGYSESVAINDELCVLSAVGTAVNIDMSKLYAPNLASVGAGGDAEDGRLATLAEVDDASLPQTPVDVLDSSQRSESAAEFFSPSARSQSLATTRLPVAASFNCESCHIPYSNKSTPFPMSV